MRIVLAGASGFLGHKLAQRLRDADHQVIRLVRREPSAADELRWDPATGALDPAALAGTDAVINLGGAGVGDRRWSDAYKEVLRDSRIGGTGTLARAIAAQPAGQRPRMLFNASGVHYYGDTGDRTVDETSPPGTGFLAELCRDWEAATAPAADAGVRVALLRIGIPLARDGGFLKQLLLPFRLGVGGRLGNGRQYQPWISMSDFLSAIELLLYRDDVAGPVNLVGPAPVTNAEFARALARQLHRPALIPVPAAAIKVIVGEFVTDALASLRVLPAVLTDRGFRFEHGTLDAALAAGLAR